MCDSRYQNRPETKQTETTFEELELELLAIKFERYFDFKFRSVAKVDWNTKNVLEVLGTCIAHGTPSKFDENVYKLLKDLSNYLIIKINDKNKFNLATAILACTNEFLDVSLPYQDIYKLRGIFNLLEQFFIKHKSNEFQQAKECCSESIKEASMVLETKENASNFMEKNTSSKIVLYPSLYAPIMIVVTPPEETNTNKPKP